VVPTSDPNMEMREHKKKHSAFVHGDGLRKREGEDSKTNLGKRGIPFLL